MWQHTVSSQWVMDKTDVLSCEEGWLCTLPLLPFWIKLHFVIYSYVQCKGQIFLMFLNHSKPPVIFFYLIYYITASNCTRPCDNFLKANLLFSYLIHIAVIVYYTSPIILKIWSHYCQQHFDCHVGSIISWYKIFIQQAACFQLLKVKLQIPFCYSFSHLGFFPLFFL